MQILVPIQPKSSEPLPKIGSYPTGPRCAACASQAAPLWAMRFHTKAFQNQSSSFVPNPAHCVRRPHGPLHVRTERLAHELGSHLEGLRFLAATLSLMLQVRGDRGEQPIGGRERHICHRMIFIGRFWRTKL